MSGRGYAKNIKCFEKLLILLSTGRVITLDEIRSTLSEEIKMDRISNYIWNIRDKASCVIKPYKEGKYVKAYQLINTDQAISYLTKTNTFDKKRFSNANI